MKTKSILLTTGLSALAFALVAVSPVRADIKEAARKLHDESNTAMVGIKGLLKIDVTRDGQPAGNQEAPIWGNGLVIGEGMVVTAYQTLVPDVAAQAPAGFEVKTSLAEVKFVDESGEEYDAKLILHDEDLDIAFLALDPKAENAAEWQVKPINITSDPTVELLDDVISMSRQSSTLRFASALKTGTVVSVVKRPRLLYAVDRISPGAPAFAADGTFLGVVTLRKSADNKQQSVPVILPAKYIRKIVSQAVEKQEELKTAPAEDEEKKDDAKSEDAPKEAPADGEKKDESKEGESTPAPDGAETGSEENEKP